MYAYQTFKSIAPLVCAITYSIAATSAHAGVAFTDVSVAAGVSGDHYESPSIHNLGVNWIDFNNDGYPDIFLVNGINLTTNLFQNNGNGTFTKVNELLGTLPNQDLAGSLFFDYDMDGDLDIFIYVDNEQFELFSFNEPDGPPNLLLQNQWVENGNAIIANEPLFINVASAAGVDGVLDVPLGAYTAGRNKTAGVLDYNRDGCPDLFVGGMLLEDPTNPVNRDTLFKNLCDGTFEDVTQISGVNPETDPDTYRPALAFIAAHMDNDLDPDMYVVNVHESSPHHHDFLYRNNSGTFTDVTGTMPGIGDDSGSGMGIDVADIDLDGDWDMYISDVLNTTNDAQPLGNVFYLGNPDGTFQDNTADTAGVAATLSWAVNFYDADNDGVEELFVGTVEGNPKPLYRSNGDGTFTDLNIEANINAAKIRGAATADYDRDGDVDLAIVNQGGAFQLYRNDSTDIGNWMELKLNGVTSSLDGIGALVKVTAGPLNMMRQIKGGSSTHSQDDLVIHFGLGTATIIDEVQIQWASGKVDVLTNVGANALYTVTEGETTPVVDNIASNRLVQGQTRVLAVHGSNFSSDITAAVLRNPNGVTIDSVRYLDQNLFLVRMTASVDAALGRRDMRFENGNGQGIDIRPAIKVIAP